MKNQRIETLDWLRGLMALSIMIYHLSYWLLEPLDASNFFGRLGIYGVSIFFILSGLSMAAVYRNAFTDIHGFASFYARRFFRILPLFWAVCILIILSKLYANSFPYSFNTLFLNATLLFGFIEPNNYIPTGAWSIGNEMVYYAFTPFILLLFNYSKRFGNIFFILTLIIGLYIAFVKLAPDIPLSEQWSHYINPFNNFFFYVMGVFIYYNLKDVTIPNLLLTGMIVISVLLFMLLPFEGNQIHLVTGIPRIIFTVISFLIVVGFYKINIQLPMLIERPLASLGIATYGIYLLHPVVYTYLQFIFVKLHIHASSYMLFGIVVLCTIALSLVSYHYVELKFIALGKKLFSK